MDLSMGTERGVNCDERIVSYRLLAWPKALGPQIDAACTGISLQDARSSLRELSARPKAQISALPLVNAVLRPWNPENRSPLRESEPVNNPMRMSGPIAL